MPIQPPDRRRDDIFFGDLFPGNGARTALAQMMSTTPSSVTQQLDPDNTDKSYYHAGKCALYAADAIDAQDGGARGDVLWNDLAESRSKWLGQKRRVLLKFPSRLAHEVIDLELNTEELDQIPTARRLGLVRKLIRDLESYANGLMLDDLEGETPLSEGEGPQRARREADTPEPRPVAVGGLEAERVENVPDELGEGQRLRPAAVGGG